MRTGDTGDGGASGATLEKATAQVLRGMNGLINHLFKRQRRPTNSPSQVLFLPVIFTTASLFVVKGDLGEAAIATGQLPDPWGDVSPVDWLWYTYNQSPALTHQIPGELGSTAVDLSDALRAEYARTIAVVGPGGVDKFLSASLVRWL